MKDHIVRSFLLSEGVFLLYAMHIHGVWQVDIYMLLIYLIFYFIVAPLNCIYIYALSRTRIGKLMYTYKYICFELFIYLLGSFFADAIHAFIPEPAISSDIWIYYYIFILSVPSIIVFITFTFIIYVYFTSKK